MNALENDYIGTGAGVLPVTKEIQVVSDRRQAVTVPGPWMFILDYARPPKGLSANDRPNRWVKAGSIADVRLEVMAKVRALRIGQLEQCTVNIVWVVGDKRKRDEDGPDPFCKAIYDGIGSSSKGHSAHLVPDDDSAHMGKPRLTIRYERGCKPHFEVTITAGMPDERKSA